ncbi:ubiquinol-cytochrome c reductase iron-sulfur subunit [Acaricomes phytoseiuli]|uniref:cytochrome bc1 complex Rieske iron-sulfur subunit n=1 Tax=Acaricomes phytoseiuli TaxID=291968 RepID=UPI00035DD3D0|nr:ubiquinol-cytochrome c reductase iron-sulfur subunit [Acaricomes phytoseiuli]MCW1249194.1 ubiquinol-cytochrome c reductase iron-sulfur subunit [Acaricomes phytoseiuli]
MSDRSDDQPVKPEGPSEVEAHTTLGAPEKFTDPGLPPHRPRLADTDPRAAKRAERQVVWLFIISILGTVLFFYGYFFIELDQTIGTLRVQNLLLGLGTAFAMLGIGTGIVHWSKTLMPDHEVVEERHPLREESDRQDAVKIVETIAEESGIKRRPLIRNTLLGALAIAPLPAVVIFRDLSQNLDINLLRHTMWDTGVRLVRDPTGTPIKAADVTYGSAFHVIPDGLNQVTEGKLDAKAKTVTLVMRIPPEQLKITPGREDWHYQGIVAYSKVCTHVGCPVALYEQQTHHLLCPCHQSTFDVTEECKVIFGPAVRPLPQLPITVDSEGYLVAQSDFHEPVGPSYWERG